MSDQSKRLRDSSIAQKSGGSGGAPSAQTISIDGGGDVWVLFGNSVAEFVGAATPVVTPFSLGVKNHTLGSRP